MWNLSYYKSEDACRYACKLRSLSDNIQALPILISFSQEASWLGFIKPSELMTLACSVQQAAVHTANFGTNVQLSCFMSKQTGQFHLICHISGRKQLLIGVTPSNKICMHAALNSLALVFINWCLFFLLLLVCFIEEKVLNIVPSSVMYLDSSSWSRYPLPSTSSTWNAFTIWSSGTGLYLRNKKHY